MFRYLIACCLFAAALASKKKIEHHNHNINSDDGKIVGGRTIDISEAAYQVGLLSNGYQFCGGAIVDHEYVLTAAHCIHNKKASSLSVRIGSSERHRNGETIDVVGIIKHPLYDEDTMDYDIALLKLVSPIDHNSMAKKIKLATVSPATGSLIFVSGWGKTMEGGYSSDILRAVHVPVVGQAECAKLLSRVGAITPRMLCAGISRGGKDSCQGDSGGPATYNGELVGVTSWGSGCAKAGSPGVYTRVSYFEPWIRGIIKKGM